NPRDDEAFKRIVNYPARGIGDTTVQRIEAIARERGVSMWEAVDTLVAEPVTDSVTRAIVRKVAEFVELIRSLSLARTNKTLYEFGEEVALRSGILATYRADSTPEAQSAIDNIEELLNTMQLFKEQRDAEIRNGEREESEEATIEEWLQSVMLMTDMDNEEEDEQHKVTLMTVHSAKGLEYEFVYVGGMEENLFPSQRALETPDGLEEERRLFYVALTRAKREATLSYAEMRFKWGNMEFSQQSRFLSEIDEEYIDADFEIKQNSRSSQSFNEKGSRVNSEGRTAVEELRKRFDYRFKNKTQEPAKPTRPNPAIVEPVRTSTDGMRRLGISRKVDGNAPSTQSTSVVPCNYSVGDKVEHPKFGAGVVRHIETLSTDHKLIVEFGGGYGEKTLLAKFAKLTKI
ncbi:MAG: ATP-binding domain-containing protein, partial [Alistipes sp.]|nr:ATP-binding domain-containing protein [Alistipes sp.]